MQATFDFEGTVDGEKFEGGEAEHFKLVLGSWSGPLLVLKMGIVGMKKGEEKVIDVNFPETTKQRTLQVKQHNSKSHVKLVEKQKLPEIDAEFLQIFGISEEEGVEKLKADVRKNMEREVKKRFT